MIPTEFIIVVYNTYSVMKMARKDIEFSLKDVVMNFIHLVQFFELIKPCTKCTEESMRFKEILNKLDVSLQSENLSDMVNVVNSF